MNIAILIPVFNRKLKTLFCLDQLYKIDHAGKNISVVVIDDGSTDGTGEAIAKDYPQTIVLKGDGNLWWTGAINMGLQYALKHDFDGVLLLNDDLHLASDFISHLMAVINDNPGALVSSLKMLENDNEILTAGFNIKGKLKQIENNMQGEIYNEQSIDKVLHADILTGASLFIPLSVVREIGFLNYSKFPHNWGDLEYTWRASLKGYKCLIAARSHVYTEYNPNYHRTYFVDSSRSEYLKNLFDNKRFCYGFKFLFNRSFMHRPKSIGTYLFMRGLANILKYIILKLFLPASTLKKYYKIIQ
ncbi:hypothetical protein MNBD_GAMMA09-3276 [hydrothermal vent metagenome]|uniref:Glycosyltransferase 2-like domain-containing protein n=1 Tax=hydrothermal vent metagenome TaxID=652676 RepID=A0A3B0XBT3_9ZZZZ